MRYQNSVHLSGLSQATISASAEDGEGRISMTIPFGFVNAYATEQELRDCAAVFTDVADQLRALKEAA